MAEKQDAKVEPKPTPGLPIHRRARALVAAQRKFADQVQETLTKLAEQKRELWDRSKALQELLETLPPSGEGWPGLYDGEKALDDGLRVLDLRFVVRHEQRLEPIETYIERSASLFAEEEDAA